MLADTNTFAVSMYPQRGRIPNILSGHMESSSAHQDICYSTSSSFFANSTAGIRQDTSGRLLWEKSVAKSIRSYSQG